MVSGLAESIMTDGEEKRLAMPPTKLHQFINAVRQSYEKQASIGEAPVLLDVRA